MDRSLGRYANGLDVAHMEKSSLTPLFRVEAGFRSDPRFDAAGSSYYNPSRRVYVRVSAENVPVFDQLSNQSRTFTIAFAWEYEGAQWWGSPAAGQTKIPPGNKLIIRADINLLKALKGETPAHENQVTHTDKAAP